MLSLFEKSFTGSDLQYASIAALFVGCGAADGLVFMFKKRDEEKGKY